MKLPIKIKDDHGRGVKRGIPWTSCSPFIDNSRAVLVHRPRYVTTHKISDRYKPHIAVELWCGGGFAGGRKLAFVDAPPDGKLLCARCEAKAVEAGLPSAAELAGQHVHIGRLVAQQVCCL